MAIGKKLRFEIFRRDNFACRYCGATAKDGAVLEPDHVIPRARGGQDVATNLVTACDGCNSGKSDTPLDAPTVADVLQAHLHPEGEERFPPEPVFAPWVEDVQIDAAIAWSSGWAGGGSPGPTAFGEHGVFVALAIAAGYRPSEITNACEAAGRLYDPDITPFLPSRDEPEEDEIHQAAYEEAVASLARFVPGERQLLIWHARTLAGDYWPTIRELIRCAGGLTPRLIEHGRDHELLSRYLNNLPGNQGSLALVKAVAEWEAVWEGERGHSAWECRVEVLEIAVGHALGAEVPV